MAKFQAKVKPTTKPFSGDGTGTGSFTVAEVWDLKEGAVGTISGTALPTLTVTIYDIDPRILTITVTDTTGAFPDLSAYTVAASSTLAIPEQTIGYDRVEVDVAEQTTPLLVYADPALVINDPNVDVPLSTRLSEAEFEARTPTLGQKTMAGSSSVVVASDQTVQVELRSIRDKDEFGRLRVATPTSLFNSKLLADAQPLYWDDQQMSGAGTASTYNTNQASVSLSVSANTAGLRARQTFQRFSYQPGKGQEITLTGILGIPTPGITRRLGYFDGLNGPYFASRPGGVYVGHYTSTSGVPVPDEAVQSAWNIDPMDGTGPSGITVDWSKTQIFVILFQWLGVGSIWHALEIDGTLWPVHRFDHANFETVVSFGKPNLPVRYDIQNDGTGAASSLTCICSTVVSSGGLDETGLTRTEYRDVAALVSNNSNWHPVLAIRLKTGYEHAVVRFKKLSLNCQSTADFSWRLVLNPVVAGTALSFVSVANDAVEVDKTVNTVRGATTITGGTDLDSASTQQSNTGLDVQLIATDPRLGVSLDGTRDVLVLAVRRDTGTNEDFFATWSWRTEQ